MSSSLCYTRNNSLLQSKKSKQAIVDCRSTLNIVVNTIWRKTRGHTRLSELIFLFQSVYWQQLYLHNTGMTKDSTLYNIDKTRMKLSKSFKINYSTVCDIIVINNCGDTYIFIKWCTIDSRGSDRIFSRGAKPSCTFLPSSVIPSLLCPPSPPVPCKRGSSPGICLYSTLL